MEYQKNKEFYFKMNIDRALEHFRYKLSSNKYTTDKDLEAYNSIVEFKENIINSFTSRHDLLLKLYVLCLEYYCKKYSFDMFQNIASKELFKDLSTLPSSFIIERFKSLLNASKLYSKFNEAGMDDITPIHLTHIKDFYKENGLSENEIKDKLKTIEEKRNKQNLKLQELLKEDESLYEYMYYGLDVWDYDVVETRIIENLSTIIEKNKK